MQRTALCLVAVLALPAAALAQPESKPQTPAAPRAKQQASRPLSQLRMSGSVYVGERAPDFDLPSSRGHNVVLSKLRGDWVLLVFADERRRFADLRGICDDMNRLGVMLLGMCRDQPQGLRAFAQRDSIPFEMVADPTGQIAVLYGLYDFQQKSTRPGFVVIDREGIVRLALLGQELRPQQVAELARFTVAGF